MDPYAVLGVDRSATEAEIVRAYRCLVLLHHPDRNGGSGESAARFREVTTAYQAIRGRGKSGPPGKVAAERAPSERSRPAPSPDAAWTSREIDPVAVERVRPRIIKLNEVVRAALADPSPANLDAVIDAARWARLDVDSALALRGHVADLRDARWETLKYTDRRAAQGTMTSFLETQTRFLESQNRTWDLVAMRNLRARIEGLLTVVRGLAGAMPRS